MHKCMCQIINRHRAKYLECVRACAWLKINTACTASRAENGFDFETISYFLIEFTLTKIAFNHQHQACPFDQMELHSN